MTVIFDAHSHCFPPMGAGPAYPPECLRETQYHVRFAVGGFRRTRDNVPLTEPVLVGDGDGASWLPEVGFRIGRFGRVEFTYQGEDYHYHLVPPSLFDTSCPPEFIIAQMDHAGVDIAVLQNCKLYGKLNDYFAECVKKYPDQFVGTSEINEFEADQESEISKLRHVVKQLGFNAIFYEATKFLEIGQKRLHMVELRIILALVVLRCLS